MIDHLVNLLLEEYKQQSLFSEFEPKGINMADVCVNNLQIVLDMIGFPKDNSLEYDYDHLNSNGRLRDVTKKVIDQDHFCRDWLSNQHFDMLHSLPREQKICVTNKGLQFESAHDENIVRDALAEYVKWLHVELAEWKKETGKAEAAD